MDYPRLKILEEKEEIVVDEELLLGRDAVIKIEPIISNDYTFNLTKGGYLLNPKFDWIVIRNGLGDPMLVPLKKRYNHKI